MDWIRRHRRGRPPHPDVLTPAEWRVLDHVREGRTNAEVAVRMGISINTVKTHVARILAKTGTSDRHALAAWDREPTDATRAALSRGFALPLAEWFTKGTATMGLKVALGGAASVTFVAGLFTVYVFFAAAGDGAATPAPTATPAVEATPEPTEPAPTGLVDRATATALGESIPVRVSLDEQSLILGYLPGGSTVEVYGAFGDEDRGWWLALRGLGWIEYDPTLVDLDAPVENLRVPRPAP